MDNLQQNIIDIEETINILIQQKEKLICDKREIELENSIINSQVRVGGRFKDVEYKKICNQQNKLRKNSFKLERSISDLSIEIMKKSTLKEKLKLEFNSQKKIDVKLKLTELRDYYINFASDKTRVSSMRAMSAEFAEKIEVLIKYF
jgi:hypothetical protein